MARSFILGFCMLMAASFMDITGQEKFQKDVFETSQGKLTITFLGHASLMLEINSTCIYIDPCSEFASYDGFPAADIILITHHHHDHLDTSAINQILNQGTLIAGSAEVCKLLGMGIIFRNEDKQKLAGIDVEAVPAYNISPGRETYHPRGGRDNGYIVTIGSTRIYIAGDTENINEMSDLKDISIAFLPMNQPYTMLPGQVAEAAVRFNPKILYPYHFGDTDPKQLIALLKTNKNIEVRIRGMK